MTVKLNNISYRLHMEKAYISTFNLTKGTGSWQSQNAPTYPRDAVVGQVQIADVCAFVEAVDGGQTVVAQVDIHEARTGLQRSQHLYLVVLGTQVSVVISLYTLQFKP